MSNVRLYFWSPSRLNTTSSPSDENGELGVQDVTRPSALVVALYFRGVLSEEGGLWRVRTTGIEAAGRPSVVSRTWHVIGGLVSVAMVGGGVGARWAERAAMRWWVVGGEGMQVGWRLGWGL